MRNRPGDKEATHTTVRESRFRTSETQPCASIASPVQSPTRYISSFAQFIAAASHRPDREKTPATWPRGSHALPSATPQPTRISLWPPLIFLLPSTGNLQGSARALEQSLGQRGLGPGSSGPRSSFHA
eukprot:3904403-Rhodomonas_salina.4